MLTSSRYGILYPSSDRSDSADVPRDFASVVAGLERTAMYGQGTLAARPVSTSGTPGIQGRFYMATDQTPMVLYYDYGTGWASVGSISAGSIGTTQLADGSVTNAKLAANAVTTDKILDGTILGSDLAAATVTATQLADALFPSRGAGAGTEALRALGTGAGNAVAGNDARLSDARVPLDGSVTTVKIVDGAVTSAKIADGTIVAADIAAGTITGDRLAADTVTAAQIAAGAVGNSELAANSVDSSKIVDGTVNTIDIADGAITSAKILDGTITSIDIADGTIQGWDLAGNIGITTSGTVQAGLLVSNGLYVMRTALAQHRFMNSGIITMSSDTGGGSSGSGSFDRAFSGLGSIGSTPTKFMSWYVSGWSPSGLSYNGSGTSGAWSIFYLADGV